MSRRHRKLTHRRFLSMETLEGRRLLVVGPVDPEVPPQNFANPEDTNYDGRLSPADALIVINALNDGDRSGSRNVFSTDVDGDGVISPHDALLVINRLNSRSATSSVPPQERAIGLRKVLDAGIVPPKMSLSDAQEMLETLEQGGHYENGERYRNGKMLNINDQPEGSSGAAAGVQSAATAPTEPTADWTSEHLLPKATSARLVEANDPFALLDSADEALADPLHDATLWQAFVDATEPSGTEVGDGFSIGLADPVAERQAFEAAQARMAQIIADAVQSGDKTVEDIVSEVAALRATLGDANSQIAQIFANLDVKGIIEQIGVDLGTLAEAMVSSGHSDSPGQAADMVEFMSREYLDATDAILP